MIVNSRKRHGIGAVLPIWGLLTACDIDSMLITGDAEDTQFRIGEKGSSCPVWRCGFNSAEVFGNPIHELDLDGTPNSAGIQIVAVIPGPKASQGEFTSLEVAGDAFVLRNKKGQTIAGEALVGTEIVLARDGETIASLRIAAFDKVPRWAEKAADAHAYALVYATDDGVTERSVCGGDAADARVPNALVLGDETYDLTTKEVYEAAKGIFTIACAGSAAAKLSLLGYGPQSSKTSVKQRQATLKMITADYCGDGHSYTQNGTPLLWENASGSVPLAEDPAAIEAVWTADGALCLDATRIAGIEVGCDLPSCDAHDLGDGEWMTYVPIIQ